MMILAVGGSRVLDVLACHFPMLMVPWFDGTGKVLLQGRQFSWFGRLAPFTPAAKVTLACLQGIRHFSLDSLSDIGREATDLWLQGSEKGKFGSLTAYRIR